MAKIMKTSSTNNDWENTIATEERSSVIFGRSLFFAFLLLVFIVVIIGFLVYHSSTNFTKYSSSRRISQIESLIEMETVRVENIALEYGWWNEAIEKVVYSDDIKWCNDHLGDALLSKYNFSIVLAYDKDGTFKYGVTLDGNLNSFPLQSYGRGVEKLIEDTIESDLSAPRASSGFFYVDDTLKLVSACVLAAYKPGELDITKSHGYLILIQDINGDFLENLSSISGIDEIISVSNNRIHNMCIENSECLLIHNPDGDQIGSLIWPREKDVQSFLKSFIFLSCVLVLCIIIISLFFFRSLYSYKKITRKIINIEKTNSERLSIHANYDELTGLPNRHLFIEQLKQMIKRCHKSNTTSSLLFLDLNEFKNINDTLGHDCGDELLSMVGLRLKEILRQEDTVARFGGDEFCILLEEVGMLKDIERVLSKILSIFDLPFVIKEENHFVGASIGVVLIPDHSSDVASLLRYADIAMYQAKRESVKQYCYYSEDLDLKAHKKSLIRNKLIEAIDNKEMSINYQPIYDLKTQRLEYVEALVRWYNPELGNISPDLFIPVAEESDMINKIGFWIIEKSIRDVMEINMRADCSIKVSINVSVRQLFNNEFLKRFLDIVNFTGIDRSLIQLEITESLLIDESIYRKNVLQEISEAGIKIVLDDFGTGYSSLSYINRIPLETIKIDKEFVSQLDQNERDGAMIKTIVFMANAYNLETVAEGIENKEQEDYLISLGCRFGQGYLYSRPVVKDDIINGIYDKSLPVESQQWAIPVSSNGE